MESVLTDGHSSLLLEIELVLFFLGNLRGVLSSFSGQTPCSSDHPPWRVMQMQLQTHHCRQLHVVAVATGGIWTTMCGSSSSPSSSVTTKMSDNWCVNDELRSPPLNLLS